METLHITPHITGSEHNDELVKSLVTWNAKKFSVIGSYVFIHAKRMHSMNDNNILTY